ncbi:MAG TPA: hypothetical protein VG168_08785, partial [Bryobacteraceae bacterium]|nr:hypothetical protein [Bryobacteraceae bacterium]
AATTASAHHDVCLDRALSSTQNVVETLEVPLLKIKRFPGSDAPNCEGWVNKNGWLLVYSNSPLPYTPNAC